MWNDSTNIFTSSYPCVGDVTDTKAVEYWDSGSNYQKKEWEPSDDLPYEFITAGTTFTRGLRAENMSESTLKRVASFKETLKNKNK